MALVDHSTSHRPWNIGSIVRAAKTRIDLWRTRRALARLDAHLLKDIGVTAEEACGEAKLTVWDVPETWRNR